VLANFEDRSGINGIGFGQETAAKVEVTDAEGFEPRDAHAGFSAGAQEGVFVASCGFVHGLKGLTHPCITNLARGIGPRARSGNCSS
jgi:hypothetical protein